MSRSGNQGLQIALIIFVMLTIVLSLTTFIFFKQAEEAEVKSKKDSAAATEALGRVAATNDELKELRRMLGQSEDLTTNTLDKVREQYTALMTDHAGAFGEVQQNCSALIKAMHDSVNKANDERRKLEENNVSLAATLESERKANADALAVERQRADKAEAELATQTAKLTQENTQQSTRIGELGAEKKAVQDEIAAAQTEHEKQIKAIQVELASTTQLNAALNEEKRIITRVTFETSDGEIRWVNQREGIVWINLGRADSLPKQLSFSVWGRDENDVARAQHKAKIEVTQLLGDHLAEARIVEDNIADPILPGDKIYTPLWQVGRQEHFAVIGKIDFNKDGVSDFRMFEELIKRSGAVIDAAIGDDGKVTGPGMTIETRYLVKGEIPEQTEKSSKSSELLKQAENLGVEIITLSKFLDHMGWKDPSRVIDLGRGANPEDFLGVGREGEHRGAAPGSATSGRFKPRRPREAARSAFENEYEGEAQP